MLAAGVEEFIGDEFGHVYSAAATGALGAGVVRSVGERLVRAVERAQRAAGPEAHLLRPVAGHDGPQVVQLALVAGRLVQQDVDARLVRQLVELRLSEQRLQRRPAAPVASLSSAAFSRFVLLMMMMMTTTTTMTYGRISWRPSRLHVIVVAEKPRAMYRLCPYVGYVWAKSVHRA